MPVEGIITSSCGERKNPILGVWEIHEGIDIAVDENSPVFASKDGKIIETGESKTYGKFLKVATYDGYELLYGHLNKLFVSRDEHIYAGEKIALSGNSGLSTGPHLHFGVYKNGKFCDPMEYINLPYTNEVAEEYALRGEDIVETKKN